MTTAAAAPFRFAGAVRDGGPRAFYRNTRHGHWVVVSRNPHALDYGAGTNPDVPAVLTQAFDHRDHALEAYAYPGTDYDPTHGADRGDAQHELRSAIAEIHEETLPIDAAGNIADPEQLLRVVASAHGHSMRVRAAAMALNDGGGEAACVPESTTATYATVGRNSVPLGAPTSPEPAATARPVPLPYGGHYWPRELYGRTDVSVLQAYRQSGADHIRISGPPGGGKTSLPFAAFGDDILYLQGHPQLTVESLYGQWLPGDPGSGERWRHELGLLPRAMLEGKVLLVDEVNRAPEDVHAALLSATDDRRQIVLDGRPDMPPITAAPGFMVVITYNDVDHGTRPLPTAMLRRFAVHLEVDTDYDLVAADGVDERFLRAARNLRTCGMEWARTHDSDPRWYPQAGALLAAQRSLDLFGVQAGAAVFVAACPDRAYRTEVAKVLESVFGEPITGSNRLGGMHTAPSE